MARTLTVALLAGALWDAGPSNAQERPLLVIADATKTGVINLLVSGPPGAAVETAESSDGITHPLATVVLNGDGLAYMARAALWRCDRRTRRFVAYSRLPGGAPRSAAFTVRTPSCRHRLALTLPRRARRGGLVRATVRDRWRIGGVRPRLCTSPPAGRPRCQALRVPSGAAGVTRSFRVNQRGRWRVELRNSSQRLRATVYVGVPPVTGRQRRASPRILLTGDSMMQSLDTVIADRLARRAEVRSEARAGGGLSKPGFDWIAQARRQVRRLHPRATVIFIGANDTFDMRTRSGPVAACCSQDWIDEYARRARAMMSVYAREGAAEVCWLTLPAPRSDLRREFSAAVNEGVRRAARTSRHVRLLELDKLFTPGFRYRAMMRVGGRSVRVRAADGVHLSLAGASIAASAVIRALKADRAL
jgi:lysophospholipase L1-like esterase